MHSIAPPTENRFRTSKPSPRARARAWLGLLALGLAILFFGAPHVAATDEDADADPDADQGEPIPCEEFVVLKDGQFQLKGAPYQLKGVNLNVNIGALATQVGTQWSHEYFFVPAHSYRPQNFSLPFLPWHIDKAQEGCSDAASCRQMFIDEHMPMLQDLGVNSVRLVGLGLDFDDQGPFHGCGSYLNQGPPCRMDLSTPAQRVRLIEIVEEVIELLGSYGIRTIYLTNSSDSHADNHPAKLAWMSEVSAAFASNPYLLAYDPFNEPQELYDFANDPSDFDYAIHCGYSNNSMDLDFCKGAAQAVSKTWFEALTTQDPYHFVTTGLSLATSSAAGYWDPFVLYDHFTSFHLYPEQTGRWDDGSGHHSSDMLANQVYYAALAGCGTPCPGVGDFDGEACFVGAAPIGQPGLVKGDDFLYTPFGGNNPCPVGELAGPFCKLAEHDHVRDHGFTRQKPTYYVKPLNGQCPAGSTFDGANCVVATGPLGASAFIYTGPGGNTHFYYQYLDPTGQRCQAPAIDDGANCRVAAVPSGFDPFIAESTHFFVEAVTCGPRKPLHLGETGFSNYPNGYDLSPKNNDYNEKLENHFQHCWNPQPGELVPEGPFTEQSDFLFGDLTPGWPGLESYSQACGFQGLHWWQLADVQQDNCRESNFGLFQYWWKLAAQWGDPAEMFIKPVAVRFDSEVDFLTPSVERCVRPSRYFETVDRRALEPKVKHQGRVVDSQGRGVANAIVHAYEHDWDENWRGRFIAFTGDAGEYSIDTEFNLAQIDASAFGYTRAASYSGLPPGYSGSLQQLPDLAIDPLPTDPASAGSGWPVLPDPVLDLATPSTRETTCRIGNDWVVLP